MITSIILGNFTYTIYIKKKVIKPLIINLIKIVLSVGFTGGKRKSRTLTTRSRLLKEISLTRCDVTVEVAGMRPNEHRLIRESKE